MDATNSIIAATRGRWAVAAMFLVNGFMTGSWAPQIPLVLTRLGITEFILGLLILCFGLGALSSMPWCGWLMSRHTTRGVLRFFASLTPFGLLLVALAPSVWTAAVALFLFGALIGSMDVAMNANAVVVEQKLSRGIMSSSHAYWSIGGFLGAGLGGVVIQGFGHLAHAVIVTVIGLAIVALAFRYVVSEGKPTVHEHASFRLPRSPGVYLVGVIALFCMIPEGAVLDWAALYLRQELGTNLATAGLAFGCFAGAMAVMRLAGDAVRNRFGAVPTLRVSALIAAAGMCVAGLSPWPWLTIAAFAVCGLGVANTVPIAFSAAGNHPDVSSGTGMSLVSTIGYSGILLAPSPIGFIAEHTGFGPIFITLSLLLVVASLMAPVARAAEFRKI